MVRLSKRDTVLVKSLLLATVVILFAFFTAPMVLQYRQSAAPAPSIFPTQTVVPTIASPSATMTSTPRPVKTEVTVDCVGPDGKHLRLTQKACDVFNNAWNPPATIVPTSSSRILNAGSIPHNSPVPFPSIIHNSDLFMSLAPTPQWQIIPTVTP